MRRNRRAEENALVDVLRSANPVPANARAGLAGDEDVASAVAFVLTFDRLAPRDAARRPNVVSPHHSVRLAAIIVVLAVSSFAIGTALGVIPAAINPFNAPEPPPSVQKFIFSMAADAPPGMDPGLIPERARVITEMPVGGVRRALWVAPTQQGGMCYGWVGAFGGCDRHGTIPLSVSWGRPAGGGIAELSGYTRLRYGETLEIRFADGRLVRPELIAVSAPIDAAFFAYHADERTVSPEATPVAVTLKDADGTVVTESSAPLTTPPRPNPIADAVHDQSVTEVAIPTADGRAQIVSAPTRYGGRCAWTEIGDQRFFLTSCRAARYDFDAFGIQPVSTPGTALVTGTVSPAVERVVIAFADGDHSEVRPVRGYVLYAIPPEHLVPGRHARVVIGIRADGTELTRVPMAPPSSCFALLPQSTDAARNACPKQWIPE